jgi:hypothetical protein
MEIWNYKETLSPALPHNGEGTMQEGGTKEIDKIVNTITMKNCPR